MPRTKRPVVDTAEQAFARTDGDRGNCAPIDWRQLSHELRTPLNAVLGNTELLLDGSCGPLSAQARGCIGEVQTAGRDLLKQVRLLLAWSELCVGRPVLTECPVDMVALVREALTSEGRGAVRLEPQDARLVLLGDRSRLRMLVAEIIGLFGPPVAAPAVSATNRAGRSALRFAWSGFCAARTGALQLALIEALACLHGAELVLRPDGLSLCWLTPQPGRPGEIRPPQYPT
jgi:His Kinase A (phospho-acceptor) domain